MDEFFDGGFRPEEWGADEWAPAILIEAEFYDDRGCSQGFAVHVVTEQYRISESGAFARAQCLAASDGYYAYWLSEEEARRKDCFIHLCRVKRTRCQASLGKVFVHVSPWRRLQASDPQTPGYAPGYAMAVVQQAMQGLRHAQALEPLDKLRERPRAEAADAPEQRQGMLRSPVRRVTFKSAAGEDLESGTDREGPSRSRSPARGDP